MKTRVTTRIGSVNLVGRGRRAGRSRSHPLRSLRACLRLWQSLMSRRPQIKSIQIKSPPFSCLFHLSVSWLLVGCRSSPLSFMYSSNGDAARLRAQLPLSWLVNFGRWMLFSSSSCTHARTQQGLIWRIGDGTNVKIWEDPWIPRGETRRPATHRGNCPTLPRTATVQPLHGYPRSLVHDIGSAYVRKEQRDIQISVAPDDIIYLYLTDEQWMLYGPMKRLFDITKDSFTNNEGSKDEEESRCECCTKCTKESTKTIQ